MPATIDQTIVAAILGDTAITALISTRFLPDTIGSVVRPAIAYQRISNPRVQSLRSDSHLGRVRLQLTIFAKSASQRSTLKQLIRARLGGLSDRDSGGVVDRIVYDNERDQHDGLTNDYMSFVDYIVWHIEN